MKILNAKTASKVLGVHAKDLHVIKSTRTSLTVTTDSLPGVTVELAVDNAAGRADVIRRKAIIDIKDGVIINVRNNEAPASSGAESTPRGCLRHDVIR